VASYLELGEKWWYVVVLVYPEVNAIAIGVLVHYFKIDFDRAFELSQ
jgi:hypothetical protein